MSARIITTKRGHELATGDAIRFLGKVHVVASVEPDPGRGRVVTTATPGVVFRAGWDQRFEVDSRAPGPYDGYMSEVEGGWQVMSSGLDLGTFPDESIAATTLAATSKRPTWKVAADGTVTRLG